MLLPNDTIFRYTKLFEQILRGTSSRYAGCTLGIFRGSFLKSKLPFYGQWISEEIAGVKRVSDVRRLEM